MAEDRTLAPRNNFDRIRTLARSDEVLSRFSEVLGPSAPVFISSLLIAVQGNEKLMECTPSSIVAAGMRAATLRLSCDPALGQAYPVPYFDSRANCYKAQFQVGYKGMIQLALRTGKYRYLNVAPVYEGQAVVEDQLRGIHTITGFRSSHTVIGYMLYFQLTNGFEKTYYMDTGEILDHAKRYSKTFTQEKGFWRTQTADMMKKTVLLAGLRRWGYFDPNDALNMTTTPDAPDQEEEEFTGLDLEAHEDGPAMTAEQEEKTMQELGFDPEPAKPTAPEAPSEPAAEKPAEQSTAPSEKTKSPAPVKRKGNAGPTAFWEAVNKLGVSQSNATAIATKYGNADWPSALAELESTYAK